MSRKRTFNACNTSAAQCSPLSALLERNGNPAIGTYENLRLAQDSVIMILFFGFFLTAMPPCGT